MDCMSIARRSVDIGVEVLLGEKVGGRSLVGRWRDRMGWGAWRTSEGEAIALMSR